MIGAGGIAESRHLPHLRQIPGVELVAVANRSQESGERAAAKFGFAKVYAHWQQVVDDPDVDIVFIGTPPYMHREIACYALEKDKHVFCQARMAANLQDAIAMLDADRASEKTTMLCPAPHYFPVQPFVLDYIDQGKLGDIRHVVLQHAGGNLVNPERPLHWRQRGDIQGINMLDVGIMGEILGGWFGPVQRLSAVGRTWVDTRPPDRDGKTAVDLPDAVSVTGQFLSGPTLSALFTGAVTGGGNSVTIYGSDATLQCFAYKAQVRISDASGERVVDVPEESQGRWTVERDFLQAVTDGRKGSPSFAAGLQYMAFTQAVYDSLRQDMKPVELYEE
jgi:predicted dehydrogenase